MAHPPDESGRTPMIHAPANVPIPNFERLPAWWDEPDVVFYFYAAVSAACAAVILGVIIIALLRRHRTR
jgi:hypothetical protein